LILHGGPRENPQGQGQGKTTGSGTGNLRSQNAFACTNRHTFSIINPYLHGDNADYLQYGSLAFGAFVSRIRDCRQTISSGEARRHQRENQLDYTTQRRRVSHTCLLRITTWADSFRRGTKCEALPDTPAPILYWIDARFAHSVLLRGDSPNHHHRTGGIH
jgi:hypothetical protein